MTHTSANRAIHIEPRCAFRVRLRVTPTILLACVAAILLASDGHAQLTKLNAPLPSGVQVAPGPLITPDSSRVVYGISIDPDTAYEELYSRPIDGSGSQAVVIAATPNRDFSQVPRISPDSQRVSVVGDITTDGKNEPHASLLDGSTPAAVRINDPYPNVNGSTNSAQFTSDSSRVVFSAAAETAGVIELYTRAADGSGVQTKLNAPIVSGGTLVQNFFLTRDASRVVFQGDLTTVGRDELYSRAIDGSGMQVKLSETILPGGNVSNGFQTTPDSARVVYYGDLTVDGRNELYTRPVDGSGVQVRINDTPVAGGNFAGGSYGISPDSSRIVYRGDLTVDTRNELFSRAIDGSGPQVSLSGTPVAGGNVANIFEITPDGSRVLFLGDVTTDGVQELYSRPIDGSGSLVTLNSPLVAGGNVGSFEITSDSSRVVFRADVAVDNAFEIYSTAVDGSGPLVTLNNPLPAGSVPQAGFIVAPNSSGVYFRVLNSAVGLPTSELYYSSFASGPAQLLFATSRTLNSFDLSPNGKYLMLRGDLETPGVNELFSLALVPEPSSCMLGGCSVLALITKLRRRSRVS